MGMPKGKNFNHPRAGSSIKVEPIRDMKAIKRIKKILTDQPRNLCLFTLGINSAYRANELLSLTVDQVDYLRAGDRLEVMQTKTNKYRAVTVNQTTVNAIDKWLAVHPDAREGQPLFPSFQKGKVLSVPSVTNLLKKWCDEVGLRGNYGSHTMRKTWGYWQYQKGTPIPLLMEAYGHTTQRETLNYLCIQSNDVQALFTSLEL